MEITYKTRIFKGRSLREQPTALADIYDLKLSPDQYITGEELAALFRTNTEFVLAALDDSDIQPIAKIINRGPPTPKKPSGAPRGGRPRLAFQPDAAKQAIVKELEKRYKS